MRGNRRLSEDLSPPVTKTWEYGERSTTYTDVDGVTLQSSEMVKSSIRAVSMCQQGVCGQCSHGKRIGKSDFVLCVEWSNRIGAVVYSPGGGGCSLFKRGKPEESGVPCTKKCSRLCKKCFYWSTSDYWDGYGLCEKACALYSITVFTLGETGCAWFRCGRNTHEERLT